MDIDKAIRIYSEFLNLSWNTVMPLLLNRDYTTDESSISDWLQCNWEILVERKILKLNEYLEVYGDGADFYGISSRITDTEVIPTTLVRIKLNNNRAIDLLNDEIILNSEFCFDKLVGFQNKFYVEFPPFNYVLVSDNDIERVFAIENVKFEIYPIKKSD